MEIGSDDLRAPYDLIVVGTGPAGLTLAHSYEERTATRLCLLRADPAQEPMGPSRKSIPSPRLVIFRRTTTLATANGLSEARRLYGLDTAPFWKNARS